MCPKLYDFQRGQRQNVHAVVLHKMKVNGDWSCQAPKYIHALYSKSSEVKIKIVLILLFVGNIPFEYSVVLKSAYVHVVI